MADPLSMTASIIAVLQMTGTVIQYLNDVKSESDEVRGILVEISNTSGLLYSLRDLLAVDESWLTAVKGLAAPSGPLEEFKSALESLIAKLSPVAGVKRLGKKVVWPFPKGEVKDILHKIERQKMLFSLALQNDNLQLSRLIQHTVVNVQRELTEINHGVQDIRLGVTSDIKLSEKPTKFKKFLQRLSAPDASSNHSAACMKRESATGTWLLESESYESWRNHANRLLWIHGIPGCGKTVLCATIIEHVKSQTKDNPEIGFGYFYGDFNDAKKQTVEGFLRSMIEQLLRQKKPFPEDILQLYNDSEEEKGQPSQYELLKAFSTLLKSYEKAYLIVDALDEFSERAGTLALIRDITSYSPVEINLLVTSRNERDIKTVLEDVLTEAICIQSAEVDADIRLYVRSCIANDAKFKKWPDSTKVEIEKALVEGSHGMFRWVVCQLESLRFCLSPTAVRTALKSLPKTLDETYDRILVSIPSEYRAQALAVFQWLAYSARPLLLAEIAEAVAVNTVTLSFDEESRLFDPSDVFSICSSLVTLSDSTMELRLAHYSVLEYLVSERIRHGPASEFSIVAIRSESNIAKTCLIYLLHFNQPDSLSNGTISRFPLLKYAAKYWFHHAKAAANNSSNGTTHLALELLNSRGGSRFINWLRVFDPDRPWDHLGLEKSVPEVGSPLYYAILLELPEVAQLLLENDADIKSAGGVLGTPLQVAAFKGNEALAERLLDLGASVEACIGNYGSAIQAAAYKGHLKLVRLLVEKGAQLNARRGRYCTSLHAAVSGAQATRWTQTADSVDHQAVVLLLINSGAKIEGEYGFYGGAIFLAVEWGNELVLQQLVGPGAGFHPGGQSYGLALTAAVSRGNEKIVQLLLDAGADVNSWGGHRGTALQTAAHEGRESMVRLLLDAGAKIESVGGAYGSALHAAAVGGHAGIVRLLIAKGASVSAEGGWDSSLLCRRERRQLVERLLRQV